MAELKAAHSVASQLAEDRGEELISLRSQLTEADSSSVSKMELEQKIRELAREVGRTA